MNVNYTALEMQGHPGDPSEGSSKNSRRDRTPITTPNLFEEKLPDLREKLGWTQANVGEFFGVSKLSAHRWEKRGAGETEARKAVLRLVAECVEASSAQDGEIGKLLLNMGVVRAVTAALHQSTGVREGALYEPLGWRGVFGAREQLGWTQVEFARFLGVTHSVPAIWESPESWKNDNDPLGHSLRAAILGLDLSSDPNRPDYREPNSGWDDLKTKGLQAFYDEVLELRIGSPR